MLRNLLLLFASIHAGVGHDPCAESHCDHDQICGVQDGRPACLPQTRLCSAWGGSHYRALDGRAFQLLGTCNYTFARSPCHESSNGSAPNGSAPIEVQIATATAAAVNATASFDRVLVAVQGFDIAIVRGELQQVWVNGLRRLLPCYLSGSLRLFPSGSTVVLETGSGLSLRYDWLQHLEVRVSRDLSGGVCGLCGSGDSALHLPSPGGNASAADRANASAAHARSWRTGGNGSLCRDDCSACPSRCEPARLDSAPGARACDVLRDPNGPFERCLKAVDPAPYVLACKDDLCSRGGDRAAACRALEAFADACQGSGITISPWRKLANCSMACPANSHYEACGSLCPATCGDPDAAAPRCQFGCAETCQCDRGLVLGDRGCVPAARCGCTHQGIYRAPNETFWADRCRQRCTCDPGSRNVTCVPARCEHDERCLVQDGALGCQKGALGLCLAQGDPHYTTFDGQRFDFHGTCMYLLAAHCPSRGTLPDFQIEVQNERTGPAESFSKMVRVRMHGYKIQISVELEDKVLVNGLLMGLPTVLSRGKVKIYKTGLSLFVESDFGLTLMYNWNNLLTLAIPRAFSGGMCGICGNFNGNKSDDLLPPTGPDAGSSDSLTRWKTGDVAGCTDVPAPRMVRCPDNVRVILSKADSCGRIMDPEGPFRDCHGTVDPSDSFDNCITDVYLNNGSRAVLCQVYAGYVAACQDMGAEVHHWRSPTFCNMACPANSEYALCAPPVPGQCAEPPSPHGAVCQEGCRCLAGFFRSGSRCVSEPECGCLHDGVYREPGAMFFPEEGCGTECTCVGHGRSSCRNVTCPAGTECGVRDGRRACLPAAGSARCSLSGGVHVLSFDGRAFDLRGTCGYALAQTCGGNGTPFSLLYQLGRVHLRVYGKNLTLTPGASGKVQVNGVLRNLPAHLGEVRVLQLGLRVQVEAAAATVILAYDLRGFVQLTVSPGYAGHLCGLCGDFDGDAANDLRLRGSDLTDDLGALAASWKVPVPGPDAGADCVDGCGTGGCPLCNATAAAPYRSEESCGLLTAPAGPFRACHSVVDPAPHFETCAYDMCVSHGDRGQYCASLQAYTLACHAAGAHIETWRNGTFCPLACPPHSEYIVCVDTCGATCANASRAACQAFRAEGCRCQPGFLLAVDRCVEEAACGCFQHGRYYQLEETSWSDGCEERCSCSAPSTLRCKPAACPAGWGCGVSNGSTECLPKGVASTTPPSPVKSPYAGVSCWVLGGSHFSTFDGMTFDFWGNCTYVLAQKCERTGLKSPPSLSPPFSVLIEKSQDPSAALRMIEVRVAEAHVVMKPGSSFIWVNGRKKYLPVTVGSITIHESSFFIFLDAGFGLSLKYDRAQYLQLSLPRAFAGVCGLCGDNNGDGADDLRTQEGAMVDAVSFGWSWRAEGSAESCAAECGEACAAMEADEPAGHAKGAAAKGEPAKGAATPYEVTLRIALWSESLTFLRCHVTVEPSAYIKLCKIHHCKKMWDADFMCLALQAYTAACQSARVQMTSWRNSTFCAAHCPKNSHYAVCGTPCPDSCWSSGSSQACALPCVETCECDAGFVFEGPLCVPAASCGCVHRGSYHPRGRAFWADEACAERCVCEAAGSAPSCNRSSCGARASCGLLDGEPACLPLRLATCSLESRRHFRTFDGRAFDFRGSCAYRLACPGDSAHPGLTPFSLLVVNDPHAELRVLLTAYNATVEISSGHRGRVTVNGIHSNQSYSLGGGHVSVATAGLRTLLHADFGLSLALDGEERLSLTLAGSYFGATCGMCGNYNGDPADDLTVRGRAVSAAELARTWSTGALPWCVEDGCAAAAKAASACPACSPERRERHAGNSSCGRLLDVAGPFRDCHAKVAPRRFHDDCVAHLCSLAAGADARPALCQALANYAAACQEENVQVHAWRSPGFCEQQCPQGTAYDLCPTLLNETCEGFPPSDGAFLPPGVCYENCVCPPGLLLSGSRCVHPGDCGCLHRGAHLRTDEVFLSCRERCVCLRGGAVTCRAVSCAAGEECSVRDGLRSCRPRRPLARCSLSGLRHYRTFDGRDFLFPGTCSYALSQTCGPMDAVRGPAPFRVMLENFGDSETRSVCIKALGLDLSLSPQHPNQVRVSGVLETLPFSAGNVSVFRQGLYLALRALDSVEVTFDLRGHVTVRLPEAYRGQTCGLCGDYNGDYNGEPGDDATSATAAVPDERYGEPAACSDACGDDCPVCVSLRPRYASDRRCGLIEAPAGPFAACHPLVDPAGYYRDCVYDLCVSEGRAEQLCDALQAYAAACREAGAPIAPWRNGTKCMLQCPRFSHYTPCANPCLTQCPEVQHVMHCPAGCVEGCECDSGYHGNGNNCVPPEECSCFLEGRRYQPGEVRLLQNCTLSCTCGPPASCKPHTCPDSHTCTVRDGVMACLSTDPCEGKCGPYDTCSPGGTGKGAGGPTCVPPPLDLCWAWGNPHFRSFHGDDFDFDGDCTYALVASGEGGARGLTPFIVTESSDRRRAPWASPVHEVTLRAYGFVLTLLAHEKDSVRVNGLRSRLPVSLKDRIRAVHWGERVVLQTAFGLQVIYDWASLVLVALDQTYRGAVYGLCTFDRALHGDDVTEWAKLQAASGDRDWHCGLTPTPPLSSPAEEARNRERCAVLADAPFGPCAERVPVEPFLRACVRDLTRVGVYSRVLDQALRSYTTICEYHGFSFQDPGDLVHDVSDQCGDHGKPDPCVSPCQLTCDGFTVERFCLPLCIPGCVCDDDFVFAFASGTCVPKPKCGCLDSIGQPRSLNEMFWSPENCENNCTCDPDSRAVRCVPQPCSAGRECHVLAGVRACYPPGPFSCSLLAGLHFSAFNNATFDFRGGYTYTLAAAPASGGGIVPFDVSVGNASGSVRLFLSLDLRVQVYGQDLLITKEAPDWLQVNGLHTPLPYSFNKDQIHVHRSPSSIVIHTDFGLRVALYKTGSLTVQVPGWYASVLRGLCGQPLDPKGDLVTPSGLAQNPEELAEAWRVGTAGGGRPLPPDPRRCSTEESDVFKDHHYCQKLLDEQGPFQKCIGALAPGLYYDACLADTCSHGGHPAAICNAIADYATACQAAGLTVSEWRTNTFCGADCPAGSHYVLCGSSCPLTCFAPGAAKTCASPCEEGCQCDLVPELDPVYPLVLSDGVCVLRSACGCQREGRYYPRGAAVVLGAGCEEKCSCGDGHEMVCSQPGCGDLEACVVEGSVSKCVPAQRGTCRVLGGYGYVTFDGQALAHDGSCSYVLAQANASAAAALPPFRVLVSVDQEGGSLDDPLKAVVLILGDFYKVQIFPRVLWKVRVNKEDFNLPMDIKSGTIKAYQDGGSSVLETDFGLQIRFTSTHYIQLLVPAGYSGATSGLCGNYNGIADDDLNPEPHSDRPPADPFAFIGSWAVPAAGQHCSPGLAAALETGSCIPDSETEGNASDPCDLLAAAASPFGPFGRCCATVPVEPYRATCAKARCATGRKREASCVVLEAYAAACSARGAQADGWREPDCRLQCPAQTSPSAAVDSCSSTCSEILTPGLCERRSEGCLCNGVLVADGDACVPISQCGCVHLGRYFKNQEVFYTPGCTKRCSCETPGGAACVSHACGLGERCLLRGGAWGCHGDAGVCQVRPDLSLRTLDGLEATLKPGTSLHLASLCDVSADRWYQLMLFRGRCPGSGDLAVHALHLFLRGTTVVIRNGTVYVDGALATLPLSLLSGDVSIRRVWAWPEVSVAVIKTSVTSSIEGDAPPDLELEASTSGAVTLRPSPTDSGKMCGACGNFNGLACDDIAPPNEWRLPLNGCCFGDEEP